MFNNIDKIIEALNKAVECASYNRGLWPDEREVLKNLEEQLPKFVENYKIMLDYIKQESIPDTMCGLHEAVYNECLAKQAKKILGQIGEI